MPKKNFYSTWLWFGKNKQPKLKGHTHTTAEITSEFSGVTNEGTTGPARIEFSGSTEPGISSRLPNERSSLNPTISKAGVKKGVPVTETIHTINKVNKSFTQTLAPNKSFTVKQRSCLGVMKKPTLATRTEKNISALPNFVSANPTAETTVLSPKLTFIESLIKIDYSNAKTPVLRTIKLEDIGIHKFDSANTIKGPLVFRFGHLIKGQNINNSRDSEYVFQPAMSAIRLKASNSRIVVVAQEDGYKAVVASKDNIAIFPTDTTYNLDFLELNGKLLSSTQDYTINYSCSKGWETNQTAKGVCFGFHEVMPNSTEEETFVLPGILETESWQVVSGYDSQGSSFIGFRTVSPLTNTTSNFQILYQKDTRDPSQMIATQHYKQLSEKTEQPTNTATTSTVFEAGSKMDGVENRSIPLDDLNVTPTNRFNTQHSTVQPKGATTTNSEIQEAIEKTASCSAGLNSVVQSTARISERVFTVAVAPNSGSTSYNTNTETQFFCIALLISVIIAFVLRILPTKETQLQRNLNERKISHFRNPFDNLNPETLCDWSENCDHW